jgi:hypothetical protein
VESTVRFAAELGYEVYDPILVARDEERLKLQNGEVYPETSVCHPTQRSIQFTEEVAP